MEPAARGDERERREIDEYDDQGKMKTDHRWRLTSYGSRDRAASSCCSLDIESDESIESGTNIERCRSREGESSLKLSSNVSRQLAERHSDVSLDGEQRRELSLEVSRQGSEAS